MWRRRAAQAGIRLLDKVGQIAGRNGIAATAIRSTSPPLLSCRSDRFSQRAGISAGRKAVPDGVVSFRQISGHFGLCVPFYRPHSHCQTPTRFLS
jgi:hypothetical protein